MLDAPGQTSPSLVNSAGFPLVLPVMFSSKRMPAQYSLFLSGDQCEFTSVDYMDQIWESFGHKDVKIGIFHSFLKISSTILN